MKLTLVLAFLCLSAIGATAQPAHTSNGKVEAVAIASNQNQPSSLAVDEESVYWVSDSGSTIKRVSKAGGVPTTLATGRYIDQILVDQENVFFTTLGAIRRVAKRGGTPTILVKSDLIGYQRLQMAMDNTNLYYYEEIGVPPGRVDKNPLLRKVCKGGGVPVTLSSRTYVPAGLATDGANVYWADHINGTVKAISVKGGRAVTLGRCVRPVSIVMDAASVYCQTVKGEIVRFKKADGTSITLSVVQNDYSLQRLVLDEMSLYVMSSYQGTYGIYRIAKTGGQPELMVPLQFLLRDFAIDDTSIYWADVRHGTVMRLNK
jgi:hypothetical protein